MKALVWFFAIWVLIGCFVGPGLGFIGALSVAILGALNSSQAQPIRGHSDYVLTVELPEAPRAPHPQPRGARRGFWDYVVNDL